ncbi:M23 family metallopeptidase [Spirochaeta dissipatitropha]
MQRQKRKNSQKKKKFGEFTLIIMPDSESEQPYQFRIHIASVIFGLCIFALMTVGTAVMANNMLRTRNDNVDSSSSTEASLELVSAEIASLIRAAETFNITIDRTIAQYGNPAAQSSAYTGRMNDIILSDNPDDLPGIAEQFYQAAASLENVERLFTLNKNLLRHIPNAWPLPDGRGIVTLEYGPNIHPFTNQVYLHKGFDIAEPRPGAPILALADGVVEKTGSAFDYGNYIWIRHRYGFRTMYAHLASIRVNEGDRVNQRDLIGTLGSSGLSTGPHLHLELWMENQILDPAQFLAISNDFPRRIRR